MKYFAALLMQTVSYHLIGTLALSAVGLHVSRKDYSFLLRQLTGILVASAYLVLLAAFGVPRTRLIFVPLYGMVLAAFLLRHRMTPSHWSWPKLHRPLCSNVTAVGVAFFLAVALLGFFWLAQAFVMAHNLVPPGDGYSWVSISLRWAYQNPLVPGDRPPLSHSMEAMNYILQQGEDMNGALLATWWLHVLAIIVIWKMMRCLGNRWQSFLLVAALSLSQVYAQNVLLGYRDALVAKWVVATMLTAIVFATRRGGPLDALMLALTFVSTALIKHEGFVYGGIAFVVGCVSWLIQRWRSSRGDLLPVAAYLLVPPLIAIGGWWLVRCYGLRIEGDRLIRDFNTLSTGQFVAQLIDFRRFGIVWGSLVGFLALPLYGLTAFSMLVGLFSREVRPRVFICSSVLVLAVLFVLVTYMATPLDLQYHLRTSLSRLMFTPSALAVAATVACLTPRGRG